MKIMGYSETFGFHPYPPPFFPSPVVSFATLNRHTNVCFWSLCMTFSLCRYPCALGTTYGPVCRFPTLLCCMLFHSMDVAWYSFSHLHVEVISNFASVLFSLFLWLPSTVPSSQSSQSSSQVALHVALELASVAFTSSQCCPSPLLGLLWSHRQVIFLLGPFLFGAGFLIVGLTVCSCPAGSQQVEDLRPCS